MLLPCSGCMLRLNNRFVTAKPSIHSMHSQFPSVSKEESLNYFSNNIKTVLNTKSTFSRQILLLLSKHYLTCLQAVFMGYYGFFSVFCLISWFHIWLSDKRDLILLYHHGPCLNLVMIPNRGDAQCCGSVCRCSAGWDLALFHVSDNNRGNLQALRSGMNTLSLWNICALNISNELFPVYNKFPLYCLKG